MPLKAQITLTRRLVEAAERFHPRAIVLDMLRGGVEPSSEELLSRMLRRLAKAHLERLRDGGRIRVQDACLLKGVPDRDGGDLQHGECFLWPQVPEDATRFAKPITGKVIIAKNPALHPGDIRVLRAVDRRSGEAKRRGEGLRNVLVFPVDTRGKRSHAHETSGGDLDGDEFFICWDSRLTACNECEPSNAYTDQDRLRQAPTADSDETLDDEAKRIQYFLEFQEKNVLELIATHWLIFACQEKEGAWSPKCLELARKHSMAVDAPSSAFPALEAKDAPASVPKFLKEFSRREMLITTRKASSASCTKALRRISKMCQIRRSRSAPCSTTKPGLNASCRAPASYAMSTTHGYSSFYARRARAPMRRV